MSAPTLATLAEDRERLKNGLRQVEERLAAGSGDMAPRKWSTVSAELKAKRQQLQARLTEVNAQARLLRAAASSPASGLPLAELESAINHTSSLQQQVELLRAQLLAAEEEKEALLARVHAGIARREDMLHVLHALLTCEDDASLTEDEYDRRMSQVERQARTLVSLERIARAQPAKEQ